MIDRRLLLLGTSSLIASRQARAFGLGNLGQIGKIGAPGGASVPTGPPALLPMSARMVTEGDSITAGSNGPQWQEWAQAFSGGRLFNPLNWMQAVGGQTAAQMATQIAATMAPAPKLVTFLGGTNDLGGSADTPATIYGNIVTCVKGYIDAGATYVVVSRILPRADAAWLALGSQPQREVDRQTLNTMIGNMASDPALSAYSAHIKLADSIESTFNPATDTANIADPGGLHPNQLGAIKLGRSFAGGILQCVDQTSVFSDLYLDASNLMLAADNPQLAGTAGGLSGATGQVANGWTVAQNDTMTVVASKTTLNGAAAQEIVASGTNATAGHAITFSNPVTTAGAIGDSFECCIDFSIAAGTQNMRAVSLSCGSTGTMAIPSATVIFDGAPAVSGTLRTPVAALLAASVTTVTVQVSVQFAAGAVACDIILARPYFRKVPAGQ